MSEVLLHAFLKGDHTPTMKAAQWEGLYAMQRVALAKQDKVIALVEEVR